MDSSVKSFDGKKVKVVICAEFTKRRTICVGDGRQNNFRAVVKESELFCFGEFESGDFALFCFVVVCPFLFQLIAFE